MLRWLLARVACLMGCLVQFAQRVSSYGRMASSDGCMTLSSLCSMIRDDSMHLA